MFKKIFGGSDKPKKEEKPAEAPKQQPIGNTQIEFEKTTYEIQKQEELFEKKIEKYTVSIDRLRNEAKEFIKAGKKKNAQFKLAEIQQYEKYITRAENQKQVFFKVRMQLQHGLENKNAAETLSKAAQILKTVDTDQLQNALEDIQDMQEQQLEVDQMFEQNAQLGVDTDGLDDMMKELEQEVATEDANKFMGDINKVPNAQVQQGQTQVQKPQTVKQPQQQKEDGAFNDALLDQLAM